MVLIISLTLLLALAILNYTITRSVLHPAVVHACLWVYQLAGLILFRSEFIPVSVDALFIVVIGALMFSLGAHASRIYADNSSFDSLVLFKPISTSSHVNYPFIILTIVSTICLYGQYRIFIDLADGADFARALIISRTIMSIDDIDPYGAFKYGTTISFGILLLLQIRIRQHDANLTLKLLFGYVLVLSLLLAILTTGRGPIVHIVILLGVTYVLHGDDYKTFQRLRRALSGIIIVMFLVFWIMGRAMGKVGDSAAEATSDIIAYQYSAIPALSEYLSQNQIHCFLGDLGQNTFRFFYAFMAKTGLVEQPPSLVQEFVSVPHATNIYTGYYFYVKDFGWVGLIVFPFMLGYVHNFLFHLYKTHRNSSLALYFLVISYLPLLQSTGGETYFTHLSTWIQLILVGIFVTYCNNHQKRNPS